MSSNYYCEEIPTPNVGIIRKERYHPNSGNFSCNFILHLGKKTIKTMLAPRKRIK